MFKVIIPTIIPKQYVINRQTIIIIDNFEPLIKLLKKDIKLYSKPPVPPGIGTKDDLKIMNGNIYIQLRPANGEAYYGMDIPAPQITLEGRVEDAEN